MVGNIDLQEKNAKVAQAQRKLLKQVSALEELDIFMAENVCSDVPSLQFKNYEREEDKIVTEQQYLLLSALVTFRFIRQV